MRAIWVAALGAALAAGWWARPGVHRAVLVVSAVVVLSAGAVTSWAGQAGHDHPAGPAHGHGASGQLARTEVLAEGDHQRVDGDVVLFRQGLLECFHGLLRRGRPRG